MKDALTQRCLNEQQVERFLSKLGSKRFNRTVAEHCDHCETCWRLIEQHLPKRLRDRPDGQMMAAFYPDVDPDERHVPQTRAECINGIRPCPWLSCRHHLWSDEHTGIEARVLSLPVIGAPSCTLDEVAENPQGLTPTEIGRRIQRRPEDVAENLESALAKLRDAGVFDVEDASPDGTRQLWETILEGQ